jgi:hypothetical protein
LVLKQPLEKSGQMPAFSLKSKLAVPKLQFWNSLKYSNATGCRVSVKQYRYWREFPERPAQDYMAVSESVSE